MIDEESQDLILIERTYLLSWKSTMTSLAGADIVVEKIVYKWLRYLRAMQTVYDGVHAIELDQIL